MTKLPLRCLLCLSLLIVLVACDAIPATPPPAPRETLPPLPTLTPAPTSTPVPDDTGWQIVASGAEVRSLNLDVSGEDSPVAEIERVTVARFDPALVVVRVLYQPRVAYPISVWSQRTGALLVMTGGYFTDENEVTGLTISDGRSYGFEYGDFAGMLAVTQADEVGVRWLREQPFDPAEPLRAGIQSFPVLVKPGGEMGFPADGDDGRPARRVVVAQDRQGRLLLLIAPRGYLSLHALAVWLADSDLDVDIALNMDGGTSAGFWMPDGPQIDSLIAVPSVIAVFPRES